MAFHTIHLDSYFAAGDERHSPRRNLKRLLLLIAVAVCSGLVSLLVFWAISVHERQTVEAKFVIEAEKKINTLKQAIAIRLHIVSLVSTFYASSFEVVRKEFSTFTDDILNDHPDIKLFAWIPRVLAEERQAHEKNAVAMGLADYQITEHRGGKNVPADQRKEYYPLFFIMPHKLEQAAQGLDLGSLPETKAVLDLARSSQRPVISYVKIPGINSDPFSTFYIIEHTATEITYSAGDKDQPLPTEGFILSKVNVRNTVHDAFELLPPSGVDIYLFDVTDPQKPLPILAVSSTAGVLAQTEMQAPPEESFNNIDYRVAIQVADRKWLAYCVPSDVYFSSMSKWGPLTGMLVCMLIGLMAVGYLYLITGHAQQVERLVNKRTNELFSSEKRFHLLVENAADGFFLFDDTGKILDINQRVVNYLGYTREELLKMNMLELETDINPELHHKRVWKQSENFFPVYAQITHKRKDGTTFPSEIRLNCMEVGGKRVIMGVARDVTERKQAEEALHREQHFLRHLINLQERDRKLMAYEIHDGLAQHIAAASFKLQALDASIERQDMPSNREILKEIIFLVSESVTEARRLISGLRPPILDEMGIVAGIEYLVGERRQSGGPDIEFVHQVKFNRLAAPLEAALFRIVQECLTNACRYSRSPNIRVELSQIDGRVRLSVQDWGVGFDPQTTKDNSFGLRGIRERVRLLSGTANIVSSPGSGTTITVELPLIEAEAVDADDD